MVYSNQSQVERGQVVAAWNNAKKRMDVLILNSAVHAAGLNLHHACHIGIGFNFVWNMNTMLQYMGRLYRIGQQQVVEWFLSTVHKVDHDGREVVALKYAIEGTIVTYSSFSSNEPPSRSPSNRTVSTTVWLHLLHPDRHPATPNGQVPHD